MNFCEQIKKSKLLKFWKNQQDADFRAKTAERRFEPDQNFRRANPIFLKENPRRQRIFEVCPQSIPAGIFPPVLDLSPFRFT
ncbi:MAG: hypothetical protein Q4A78_08155 [Peptostreptococcaceae bacterium]|nr:hypothetical protein [Peptostreptococcaceae bacterium]